MSLLHKLHNAAHAVGEYVTPVLKTSAFAERGVLTPEEFIKAGDQLVRTCPTWQWASGDPSKKWSFLPDDKQFLVTKGVACEHRVKDMEATFEKELQMEGAGDDGSWIEAHHRHSGTETKAQGESGAATTEKVETVDFNALNFKENKGESSESAEKETQKVEEADEDGFIDLNDFVEENIEAPDALAASNETVAEKKRVEDEDVVQMRTYDLSITYDKYYQTPRVWLQGFDEQQSPLSGEAILEDIMQDYANKTVTIEPHPQLTGGTIQASIHPCKHAEVMKKIVANLSQGGKTADPSQYLFIFLKFIQSVIPTINYDNTIEVEAM